MDTLKPEGHDALERGKKELQQVARQVRESKAVARTEPESPEGVIARLRQTIRGFCPAIDLKKGLAPNVYAVLQGTAPFPRL